MLHGHVQVLVAILECLQNVAVFELVEQQIRIHCNLVPLELS